MVYRPIQIKHSVSSNAIPILIPGELAFTQAGNNFFIGSPDGSAGNIRIGHKFNDGILTANQALVANSTGGINRVYTSQLDAANLNVQNITVDEIRSRSINVDHIIANNSPGANGYVLTSAGPDGSMYWTTASSLLGDLLISSTGSIFANNFNAVGIVSANSVIANTVTASNVVAGNVRTNSVIVNNFVFNSVASTANQQIYTSNGSAGYWSSRYYVGGYEVVPDAPNYGDVWYSTIDDKPFMWVNNGNFDTWYDFLPPTF